MTVPILTDGGEGILDEEFFKRRMREIFQEMLEKGRREGAEFLLKMLGMDKEAAILYVKIVKYCFEKGERFFWEDEMMEILKMLGATERAFKKLVEEDLLFKIVKPNGILYEVDIMADVLAIPRLGFFDPLEHLDKIMELIKSYEPERD